MRLPFLFAAAAMLVLAACGSTPASPATPSTAPSNSATTPTPLFTPGASASASATPSGPQYTMQVNLSGVDTLQGTATVPAHNGCVQPTQLSATFGAHVVSLQITLKPPSGQQPPMTLSPGDITVTVDDDAWTVASSANAPQGTQGTISFMGSASGAISVQHLFDNQSAQGPSSNEGGTITWSCAS